jgi:hypothetical protein
MASNGLLNKAKKGKCEYCLRVRKTAKLSIIGEVRHGFATGYKWKCDNAEDCQNAKLKKDAKKHH